MPTRRTTLATLGTAPLAACAAHTPAPVPALPDNATLVAQVTAAETAFARSMADRDLAAFARWVADDAVFVNNGTPVLTGKAAIVAHWARFYEKPAAPFSWAPELVAVLPSGQLAQSLGPVRGPDGAVFAYFYSTWRREADGGWRVVLDNGYRVQCPA